MDDRWMTRTAGPLLPPPHPPARRCPGWTAGENTNSNHILLTMNTVVTVLVSGHVNRSKVAASTPRLIYTWLALGCWLFGFFFFFYTIREIKIIIYNPSHCSRGSGWEFQSSGIKVKISRDQWRAEGRGQQRSWCIHGSLYGDGHPIKNDYWGTAMAGLSIQSSSIIEVGPRRPDASAGHRGTFVQVVNV